MNTTPSEHDPTRQRADAPETKTNDCLMTLSNTAHALETTENSFMANAAMLEANAKSTNVELNLINMTLKKILRRFPAVSDSDDDDDE